MHVTFVLAAWLALIHGNIFISHLFQGWSQTEAKETFPVDKLV